MIHKTGLPGSSQRIAGSLPHLELWGGAECTCNRVRNSYFDQMTLSGHADRISDLERFAELGIKALRIGVLWERHHLNPDWRWSDERLACLHSLGIRPLVGLVHHGSGPEHTDLLDPGFPQKLAAYAAEFAERYPWVDVYTPVNEPHTTARFSAMYGVWYPHARSRRSFLRALLNQLRATVLSMQAIRRTRSDALLLQTDDLGSISGTRRLRPHWELLNLRQWLPFDLLAGRVDRFHPLFSYMRDEGISEHEIFWFAEHPCPAGIIGANYYVTSDRYVDERLHLYPEDRRSAEGPFADVETVRVEGKSITGFSSILLEAWRRYSVPVAATEVHIGCTVDEQIRWTAEAWSEAMLARSLGVPCLAITSWALLGSFFWNSLVTRDNGHYEPGAFDVSSGDPVPTELADVLTQIGAGNAPRHPALSRRGWWHAEERACFQCRDDHDIIPALACGLIDAA